MLLLTKNEAFWSFRLLLRIMGLTIQKLKIILSLIFKRKTNTFVKRKRKKITLNFLKTL